jgi:UDP-N-acetylglucosamine--N-acetylmuramyl-(pentapeptide) pyrophosphoryl-undecaprenol N-acetylglucosamine transferase
MKILISGGGTGGHIYPAISILESFSKQDEILYVGKKNSMESELIKRLDIPFKAIIVEGLNRKNKLKNVLVIIKLIIGMLQSLFIILSFKPDIVIGTGGYVSGPVVFMATIFNKKTFIHEQNAYPGITNRILAKYVDKVFVSYKDSISRFKNNNIVYSGNPIRRTFKEVTKNIEKSNNGFINVLSFGGSGGAKKLNDLMYDVIKDLKDDDGIVITHVTGKKYYNEFIEKMKKDKIELGENISIVDYLNEMPRYMVESDLVISRAGAISISELKYTKTPSILIPSPNVTDNHQEFNAREMEKEGLAKMILENDVSSEKILQFIKSSEFIGKLNSNFIKYENEDASKLINVEIIKEVLK